MMKIELCVRDKEPVVRDFEEGLTIEEMITDLDVLYPVLCARNHNKTMRLDQVIKEDTSLTLLDQRDFEANMIYQSSLTLLYVKAVHDLFGPQVEVEICNSLSKGLYTVIRTDLDSTSAERIQTRMQELVDSKLPIVLEQLDRAQMIAHAESRGRRDQMRLLESARDLKTAYLARLEEEEEIFYEALVPNTSYLKYFEVRRYKNGMLLRFPHPSKPDEVPVYEEQPLLYGAFSEMTRWDKLMGVRTAADLNHRMESKDCLEMVLMSEALHEKKIAEIAQTICDQKKRIILIAGPSSSGKTTFAKRLCIQLMVTGLKPLYLGTDDYFLEREETPIEADGTRNYEALSAMDVDLFNTQMNALLSGAKVDLPSFNFVTGKKEYGKRITSIHASQPIVLEGLHCLNPELTSGISAEEKFHIYISPLTQLNIDEHNRIPTTDARMLRRIVRDAQFRSYPASRTMEMWPSVRKGEDEYIFPFAQNADVFFNSHVLYELPLLKKYAQPLLEDIDQEDPMYPEAQRMLRFLQFFVEMKDDSIIPNNSLMREFIGGSVVAN